MKQRAASVPDLFWRWKSQAAAEYRGWPACVLMQTHTHLLNSPAWVEAPLTECTSRKPFSHTGPNKPVLLAPLFTHTHTLARTPTSLSFKCQSHDTRGRRRICVRSGVRVCICAHSGMWHLLPYKWWQSTSHYCTRCSCDGTSESLAVQWEQIWLEILQQAFIMG